MEKIKNRPDLIELSPVTLQFGCLLLVGLMDLFLLTVAPLHPWLFEYLVDSYAVVPALIFLGIALSHHLTQSAKHNLLLGLIAVIWMALAQAAQRKALDGPMNITTWWAAYLLAFPFASIVRDGTANKGLKLIGKIAVVASVYTSLCSMLMILNMLPPILQKVFGWDGQARLLALMHPNMSGWLLMIGIAFSLGLLEYAHKKLYQGLLIGAVALQLVTLALTNSRTTILMTAALVAGMIFFRIFKGSWKQLWIGLLTATVVVGVLFVLSDAIFDNHVDRMINQQTAQTETTQIAAASAFEENTHAEQPEDTSKKISKRRGFWEDFVTFNGRTGIWKAGLESMKMHPEYFIRGTWLVGGAVKEGGNPFEVLHSHNSWMEMLIGFGIPGLILALYFTFLALRGACCILFTLQSSMLQKCVALLVLCMLGAGVLEPFLFTAYLYCHFYCVVFMLCVGYLNLWREEIKHPERV